MPATISRRKRVRFSSDPPKSPGRRLGREKLVAQVAVTVLQVDEVEADVARVLRGDHVVVDELADVAIAHQRIVGRETELAIEDRMPIEDHRLHPRLVVGLAEASRVRELQSDHEIVVVAHRLAVPRHERLAHRRDLGLGGFGHQQLVGIGAAVVAHRDRFAAPDHLGAGEAEVAPAADGVLGRSSILEAVPSFHRLDRETIADGELARRERRAERGVGPR